MLKSSKQIRLLRTQLAKLEAEENKEKKIGSYARVILKLSQLVYSKKEREFLSSCVEDRVASGRVEETGLEFVDNLKKKLNSQ